MNVRMCDACKKIVGEKEIQRVHMDLLSYELCEDCKEKFLKFKNDFDTKNQELNNQYNNLYENFRNNLTKIGLK